MLPALFLPLLIVAQHMGGGGIQWNVGNIAIAVVIVVAIIAIVLVMCRVAGIAIPPWIWTIAWICLAAFVAILAIRFVLSL